MLGLVVPYDDLVVATWDAARSGIALAVAVKPGVTLRLEGMKFEGVSTIVTLEVTPDAQAHREAAGAPMALRLIRRSLICGAGRCAAQRLPIGHLCFGERVKLATAASGGGGGLSGGPGGWDEEGLVHARPRGTADR